jgi:uncharacterized protein YprB with RNaseH-like and TPR domain
MPGLYAMLLSTFQHIPHLGEKRERALWRRGIHRWDDFLANPGGSGLPPGLRQDAEAVLRLSQEALRWGNIYFFAQLLPPREHWRLYANFQAVTGYLDIETGNLGGGRQGITVIGLFDGQRYMPFIRGHNLHKFEAQVRQYDLLITFNGKAFDAPLIERDLGIPIYQSQIDLKPLLQGLGFRGGLKRIEREFGLTREAAVAGLTGFDAVWLWERYRHGDMAALDRLLAYNRADVVNLEPLLQRACALARERAWTAAHASVKSSD